MGGHELLGSGVGATAFYHNKHKGANDKTFIFCKILSLYVMSWNFVRGEIYCVSDSVKSLQTASVSFDSCLK